MIPWGAIAVAVWAASRNMDPNGAQGPSTPPVVVVIVLRWLLAAVAFSVTIGVSAGTPFAALALPVGVVVITLLTRPTALLEGVLVPLGMARAAWWWTYLTVPLPALYDTVGARAFYAARALLRQPSPDGAVATMAEEALAAARPQRTGLSVAAAGLLAIARGSVDHGRVLLASLDALEAAALPRVAREVARTWRVADALAAGDIDRSLRAAEGVGFTPWPALVRLEVARARGDAGAWWTPLWRIALWALAPSRGATRRFFAGWRERTLTLPAETDDALADALAVHQLLGAATPTARGYTTALAEACRRWERAFQEPATRARVERRRLALNLADDAPVILDRFAADVEGELVAFAARVDAPLGELDATTLGERVRYAAREADFAEVEALLATFRAQTDDFPAAPEAWALFARLHHRVDAAVRRHDDARDALATGIFNAVTNWTCRLYNDAHERCLGRAVFVWVRRHADSLPARDLQLAIKNARVLGY